MADCGLGNLHSLLSALTELAPNDKVELSADPARLRAADCVFLPGDGSFGACIAEIDARGLRQTLVEIARSRPFFGICVGMQVLFEASAEAPGVAGLRILPGTIKRFVPQPDLRVPLMGWLDTCEAGPTHPVLASCGQGERYYFMNSYYAAADGANVVLAAHHGVPFAAAVATTPALFATQFHPEKSQVQGRQLLKDFVARIN